MTARQTLAVLTAILVACTALVLADPAPADAKASGCGQFTRRSVLTLHNEALYFKCFPAAKDASGAEVDGYSREPRGCTGLDVYMVVCHPEGGDSQPVLAGIGVGKKHAITYFLPRLGPTKAEIARARALEKKRIHALMRKIMTNSKTDRATMLCTTMGFGTGIISATAAPPFAPVAFLGGMIGGCIVGFSTVEFG